MTTYSETFRIGRRTYGIEASEGGFKLWGGGCAIGRAATVEEARKLLHVYVTCHVSVEKSRAEIDLVASTETLELLGSDPFNLGRFRVA